MIDLTSITEGIKIQFTQPESMKFRENYFLKNGGFIAYSASIEYEVIGAYRDRESDRIKVVTYIRRFDCTELAIDFAHEEFEKRVKQEIIRRIPEAKGCLNIMAVTKQKISQLSKS